MGSPERFDRADANGPGQKPDDGHERGKQKGGAIRPRRVDDQASHDRRYNPRDVAEAVLQPDPLRGRGRPCEGLADRK